VILPREEGKFIEPTAVTVPKKKKSKALVKVSPPPVPKGRHLKTAEIVANDNNAQCWTMFSKKFDAMRAISKERMPTGNPLSLNTTRVPKQHAVFADHNINFEAPVTAPTIALMRHERVMADRAKLIAAQRAHQAELVASAQAARAPQSTVPLTPPPEVPQGDIATASTPIGSPAGIETIKTIPAPTTAPTYVSRSDIISTPPEPARPITVPPTSGSNVFVQLGGVQQPGPTATQSQIHIPAQALSPVYVGRTDVTPLTPPVEPVRQLPGVTQSGNHIFVQLPGLAPSHKLASSVQSPNQTYDGTSSQSESTRPLQVATPSGNIFVHLTGLAPGTKLTQAQINQLRQTIVQQSAGKGYIVPTSQQQTRHETPATTTQQIRRIQIVPTTQANMLSTTTTPTQITIPAATTPSPSSTAVTSQSLNTLTAGGTNIVAINTGSGTRVSWV